MEEAYHRAAKEAAGLRVLLDMARKEAHMYELLSNKERSAAVRWKTACETAQEIARSASSELNAVSAALEFAELELKRLRRLERRRSSAASP